jgi:hypothetical protein
MNCNQTSWSCYGLEASGSLLIATVSFFIRHLVALARAINSAAAVIKARLIRSLTLEAAHMELFFSSEFMPLFLPRTEVFGEVFGLDF